MRMKIWSKTVWSSSLRSLLFALNGSQSVGVVKVQFAFSMTRANGHPIGIIDIYRYLSISIDILYSFALFGVDMQWHASRRGDLMQLTGFASSSRLGQVKLLLPLEEGKSFTEDSGPSVVEPCRTISNHFPWPGLGKSKFDANSPHSCWLHLLVHAGDNCFLCWVLLCLLPCCTLLLWYIFKGSWCLRHAEEWCGSSGCDFSVTHVWVREHGGYRIPCCSFPWYRPNS